LFITNSFDCFLLETSSPSVTRPPKFVGGRRGSWTFGCKVVFRHRIAQWAGEIYQSHVGGESSDAGDNDRASFLWPHECTSGILLEASLRSNRSDDACAAMFSGTVA
jgi:hypothetical protein